MPTGTVLQHSSFRRGNKRRIVLKVWARAGCGCGNRVDAYSGIDGNVAAGILVDNGADRSRLLFHAIDEAPVRCEVGWEAISDLRRGSMLRGPACRRWLARTVQLFGLCRRRSLRRVLAQP